MSDDGIEQARKNLVTSLRERGYIYTRRVERAMGAVPRHEFVPDAVRGRAYADEPLDIGHGQVVTAPHLVAQMTELLELRPGQTVLEIGTGSGYHAAVLAEMVGPENVFTIERVPALAESARDALSRTGYGSVTVIVADGSGGLPDEAPFDRINVTSVAPEIPDPLVYQLADGGRMVIPLGPRGGSQELVLVTNVDGRVEQTNYGGVRFVPLIGEHGFADEE
ncbi:MULTISPECIES: protein-L-isoaspartate(D-aspartate) O-methyltransferase [Haloferax]|uniref:Protein-L-isoaspartate O-methyltransferase n=2 Tax=Haloferax TaxID=2251 RepID=A0A6G1Z1V2_9EURY|nr:MULTISPECIES: protein-L-isoaspartate(D-aspartate) O-methyltransferase [Haloferax]KAB1187894.1 protein-L-isoaspartate(D-aspartate) O-methyltransferase [Haloferax sp. CBA1149]MRW80559.1 protein-L-isoaspartate(D-aspartate) O-methyltransferase [Haloferax marinisediminis]